MMRSSPNGVNLQPEKGNQQGPIARGRFAWLRSRWAILSVLACLVVALILFGNGSSQASLVRADPASILQKGQFSPRAYQFTGQGKVLGGAGNTWIVGGVPVSVSGQAQVQGEIHPGDPVSLLGHITQDGKWVAERVSPISEDDSFFSFAGPLDSRSEKTWQVAGIPLVVNDQTRLGEDIQLGELVLATFKVQADNTWLALQIQTLSALEANPSPTAPPTAMPTPTLTATQPSTVSPKVINPAPGNKESPKPKPNENKHDNGKHKGKDKNGGKGKGK
jgi:hypothetical protein